MTCFFLVGKVKRTSPEMNQEIDSKSDTPKSMIQSFQIKRVQSAESLKPAEPQKRKPTDPPSSESHLKKSKSIESSSSSSSTSSSTFVSNKHFSYVGYSESEVNGFFPPFF